MQDAEIADFMHFACTHASRARAIDCGALHTVELSETGAAQ
jgi:hypothetical protein